MLPLILVFMLNNPLSSVFQGFFATINKIVILEGGLGTRLSLYGVLRLP